MNSLDNIWAKSNPIETLKEHTENVIKIWSFLRKRYAEEIQDENFWQLSFLAVAFHDFGKICNQFQLVIKRKKSSFNDERVRHEFFSGMFLLLNNPKFYMENIESLAAVFSHHKAFNDEGLLGNINRNLTIQFELDEVVINEFIDFVNKEAKKRNLEEFINSDRFSINASYRELFILFKRGFYSKISEENFLNSDNRKRYIYHKAILNIADWTASGNLNLETGIAYNQEFLENRIIGKLREDNKMEIANNFDFREFQKESLIENSIIAIAPTGSGKTEASLLWASSKKDWERIIYLLPTRVTSNAIYKRLSDYFGSEYTQLIHSSARQYIKEQFDDSYDQKKYFRDKSFFKNINVCTVDQLLTLGFNLGFWEVKTFHMLNAKIIIDEIHLYSPYTLGLIISTIKYLIENFNSKFYIMSATMPDKLKILLENALGNFKLIQDKELLNQTRNRFEVRESSLQNNLQEIKSEIQNGKKVLIVVNTVDQAIQLYDSLKSYAEKSGYDAVCYHSRFIKMDRFKKEKEIFTLDEKENGGVLIATQVVEVSLDIDFDILFTENAPIDAIIQRAGRVNRKRKKENSKVVVFPHSEVSEKYVYNVPKILKNTMTELSKRQDKKLTELELLELVNTVYKDIDIESNDSFKSGLEKHLDIQIAQYYVKDLTTDEKVFTREGLDSISVIPNRFEEQLSNLRKEKKLSDTEFKDILSKHELSVSKNKTHFSRITKNDLGFKFIDSNYDDERGLTFKKREENNVLAF